MNLKPYQEEAVQKLFQSSRELLSQGGNRKLVFKAPTGAGKTIMMAEFLRILAVESPTREGISVIWTAPRKLHTQSMDKLKKHFADTYAFKCSEFRGLVDKAISSNEILFMNWESINKTEKNTIVVENEDEFYLSKVIENTKNNGNLIVLIIDESHHHATSEVSQSLISDMQPDLTIEVSATPVLSDVDEMVVVQLDKVKEQGMIKKAVVLNPDFENTLSKSKVSSSLASGTDLFVLGKAMEKLRELQSHYLELGSPVKPLLLIQLPNKTSDMQETLQDELTDYLAEEHGVSAKNKNLAVYLSESTQFLENITKNDSPVEVMFFKQAISLGWDCPRASILVLFRDHKRLIFSVPTVGRIMRMPEPQKGHYAIEALNHAYVFTNLADISINEDVSSGYLSVFTSKRKEEIKPLNLESVYSQRQRERTRLSSDFTRIFLEVATRTGLSKKLDLDKPKVKAEFITDYQANSVDQLANAEIHGVLEVDLESEQDLQKLFDFFIVRNLAPFFPERRSVGRIKEAIYKIFIQELNMDYEDSQFEVFRSVLGEGNQVLFSNVIDETKKIYQDLVSEKDQQLVVQLDWTLPESVNYPATYHLVQTKKAALTPHYADKKWKSETLFVDFLEGSSKVEWWFKNGDRDATYFAVPYQESGVNKPFYVDFIVSLTDGSLALFDTKGGQTIETAKAKSDGLQDYLSKHKGIFGGIVANTSPDYSGRWVYFIKLSNEISKDNFANWETLEL
jgi:type III restriction enzyme